jgi:BirA family biotin operon repressor/biotin-[acetyl-CoA-carboxylase] ligase
MMKATIESVAGRFPPGAVGSEIRYLETIDSTNRLALELPGPATPHGLVLVAGRQTAGRGRQGRVWLSLPGVGLHFTVVLRPTETSNRLVPLLTLAGALAVRDALTGFCSSPLDIRWPNDVLLGGGKVSGILGEAAFRGAVLERVALGISVNVGHRKEDFPAELASRPVSILMAEGRAPGLPEVLESVLLNLDKWYEAFAAGRTDAILDGVRRHSSYVSGKRLRIDSAGEVFTGTSAGLGDDGSLRLRLESGLEVELLAGDVRVLGE